MRRAVNRTMAAVGAPVGGLGVGLIGESLTLAFAIVGFLIAALAAAFSPLRHIPHQYEEQ